MPDNSFATFKPFTSEINTPENILNYFETLKSQTGLNLLGNQLNPYMGNYLGITPAPKTEDITKVKPSKTSEKSIINWLKEGKSSLPTIPEQRWDYTTNSGEKIDLKKGETGNAKRAIDYLTSKEGLSKEQAVAIAANLHHESRFNTSAVGDTNLGKGQEAVGIAQWRLDRKANMFKFLKDRGLPATSFEGQLSFLVHELKNRGESWKNMNNTNDVEKLAENFDKYYERSDGKSRKQRSNLAKQLYKTI